MSRFKRNLRTPLTYDEVQEGFRSDNPFKEWTEDMKLARCEACDLPTHAIRKTHSEIGEDPWIRVCVCGWSDGG